MKESLIIVDIGNTSVSIALADGRRGAILSRRDRLSTRALAPESIAKAMKRIATDRKISDSVLCSVVPSATRMWKQALRKATGRSPLVVDHRLKLGVGIALRRPEKIGADRLANACAASFLLGIPAIVIDFGTATTFDVISADNEYIGGVIAPGLPLMTDYFAERTALLPRLPWIEKGMNFHPANRARRGRAVGTNTEEAMLIGAETGYIGMIREILARLRNDVKGGKVKICATGGYAKWLLAGSDLDIPVDPDLTLRGLMRIYEINRS
jgi:type III pantothenate kinase